MRSIQALVVTVAVTLLCTSVSEAALILKDYQTPGDNLIVADTATNLEWLNWAHTNGMSYNAVSAQLGPGGAYEGFRYATASELLNLYLVSVGFPTVPVGDNGPGSNLNVPFAEVFTSLFGITFGSPPPVNGGVEAVYGDSPALNQHWVTAINHNSGNVTPQWFFQNDNSAASSVGHALVRVAAATEVPEPTSVLVWCIGSLGMVWGTRRRAKT
jgi:hypothetical protein